jgi:SWI/SNF-related matrix-associated actin-dependent regulator 1 of chromatin subfamily A
MSQRQRPLGTRGRAPSQRPVVQFGVVGAPLIGQKSFRNTTGEAVVEFERQSIVGTLTQKGLDKTSAPALPAAFLERVKNNIRKIYEEGRFSASKSIIDFKDGELLVSFSFNQTTVERFKGLDKNERAWDPDARCWRVFVGAFDDVLDSLGKGVKFTDAAFEEILRFVDSNYYAHIGKGKLGKLIVRESWFEEVAMAGIPGGQAMFRSSAHEEGMPSAPPVGFTSEAIHKMVEDFPFERHPYAHQRTGIEFLIGNPESALLDEMGCGKSYQIASAASILLSKDILDAVLIVAPMSLLRTWQDELRFAGLNDFMVISGTPKQREKALQSNARVFVVHYEGLRIESARLSEWMKNRKTMLVFDESQRIKNLQALTTKAAQLLRPFAERCVIATGTPIANRPLDLFSQYLVLDKGRTFGVRFAAFKNTFCEIEVHKIQVGRRTIPIEKFLGVRNGAELHKRITQTSLRRLKSQVLDLPPVIYKDYVVELHGEQKTLYAQMRDNLRLEVTNMTAQELKSAQNSIAVKLLRLAQISSNPALIAPKLEQNGVKFSEVDDILEDVLADETKKVILWTHFVENVSRLVEKYAEKWGAVGHTGEMDVDERQTSVGRFRDDVTCRLFVATPQSAKEGLTLLPRDGKMVADTMIYLDLSFDSASYVQSQARFHRIGQAAERCLVIHVLGDGTVDEYIRKAVVEKIRTATRVLDDNESVSSLVAATRVEFSREDLLKIL